MPKTDKGRFLKFLIAIYDQSTTLLFNSGLAHVDTLTHCASMEALFVPPLKLDVCDHETNTNTLTVPFCTQEIDYFLFVVTNLTMWTLKLTTLLPVARSNT